MPYYAVMPNWPKRDEALKVCRIEKAPDAREAVHLAFGRGSHNKGTWLVKETTLPVIRSDNKRIAMLTATDGWFDPFFARNPSVINSKVR